MADSPGPSGGPAAQLDVLQAAAAALRVCSALAPAAAGGSQSPPATVPTAAAVEADWERRLAAVNAAVGSVTPRGERGGLGAAGGSEGGGSSTVGGLPPFQAELAEAVASCEGNCVTFLPLGTHHKAPASMLVLLCR